MLKCRWVGCGGIDDSCGVGEQQRGESCGSYQMESLAFLLPPVRSLVREIQGREEEVHMSGSCGKLPCSFGLKGKIGETEVSSQ